MPTLQNDVGNSGIIAGRPLQYGGITCSAQPGTVLGRRLENYWVPVPISASGLNQALANRFDDPTYYTA